MASNFDNPSLWRLFFRRLTATKKVRFKIVAFELDYDISRASGIADIIVAVADIQELVRELLPPPKKHNLIYVPQFRFFDDTPFAITGMSIKSFDSGIPIDPLDIDAVAPGGTYYPTAAVRLTLGIPPSTAPDPYDPKTYLEISSSSTGDFYHSPATDSEMQATDSRGEPVPPADVVQNPLVPFSVLAPQTEWTLKWNSIPLHNYEEVIVPRLNAALGKVNQYEFPPLGITTFNTLLFVSYAQERVYTWQQKIEGVPKDGPHQLVNLSMQFLEKNIKVGTEVHGHQSFWVQPQGWKYLTRGGLPTFQSFDMLNIFRSFPNPLGPP